MTSHGLLSIITATYNNANLLPRFFDSIINQEYKNWELLIVNDGSTDNTAEVCASYVALDSRIRYYEQANQGQGVARNYALTLVRGEYIAFIDSDDAIKPSTYSSAINLLAGENGCDMVAYPMEWINKKERFIKQRISSPILGYNNILDDLFVNNQLKLLLTDKLYRAELIAGLSFEPKIVFEDCLLMAQIARRSKGICFSTEGAYEYHQEEYIPGKNKWTKHKEESQIFVNCKYIDELSNDNLLKDCRVKVYQQIGNQLAYYIKKEKKGEYLLLLKEYMKSMPLSDILYTSLLSLKHKGKLLYLKLRSLI